nr:MAG TPA: hypothetical protein [Caudoviricetes sp.]
MLYVLPLRDVGCGLHPGWLCLLSDHDILPGFYTMFHHLLCYSIIAGMNSAHKHHADPVHFIAIITATVVIIHEVSLYIYLPLSLIPFRNRHPRHNLIRFSLFIEPDTCLGIIQCCCLICSLDRNQKLRCVCTSDI